MKHKTLILAILAFIILPVGAYFFFTKKTAAIIKLYTAEKPVTKDLTQYITASGRLKALEQITVGSLVAGRVVKLHVDDNDAVEKNQVLVELDDGVGYSAVKKAQAALDQAKANAAYQEVFFQRQTALYDAGQLAKDTFQSYEKTYLTAKAQVLASEADLEISRQTYDNLFIKAPAKGTIISRKVDLGQMVTAQLQATELFIIARDLKKMEAEIDVDEADIGVVRIGQEAEFTVDAFPQIQFEAKVKQINYSYKVVENVITYATLLDVNNPDLTLRPGMTTNVSIKVADTPGALCIPNKVLRVNAKTLAAVAKKEELQIEELVRTQKTKNISTVWTFENDKFKEVEVKLGVNDGQFVQVLSGITPETNIVTEAFDPNRENPVMSMGKLKA